MAECEVDDAYQRTHTGSIDNASRVELGASLSHPEPI